VRIKLLFSNRESKNRQIFARSARQKKVRAELIKFAKNLPEIGTRLEILFARQMIFKSARICFILAEKLIFGNLSWQRCPSLWLGGGGADQAETKENQRPRLKAGDTNT
jgi:hypothetical protein